VPCRRCSNRFVGLVGANVLKSVPGLIQMKEIARTRADASRLSDCETQFKKALQMEPKMKKIIGTIVGVCFVSGQAMADKLASNFIGSWMVMEQFADKQQESCSKSDAYNTVITSDKIIDGNNQRCKIMSVKSGAEYVSATVSVDQFCENDHYGSYKKTELWTVFDIGRERYIISVAAKYPDRLMGKTTAGILQGSLLKQCR